MRDPLDGNFMQLSAVVKLLEISSREFIARVQSGEYPQPVSFGERHRSWRTKEIHALHAKLKRKKNK